MPDRKLEKLQKILEMTNEDYATSEEVATVVAEILKNFNVLSDSVNQFVLQMSEKNIQVDKLKNEYLVLKEIANKLKAPEIDIEKIVTNVVDKVHDLIPDPINIADIIREVLNEIRPLIKEPLSVIDIRNGLEILREDERLDKKAIRGLDNIITQPDLDRAIGILDSRTSFLINKINNLPVSTNSGTGGYTIETPSGSLYDQSTGTGGITFTVTATPVYIIADGVTYFENFGYTLSGLTVTMTNPVTQYIRSFHQ